MPRSSRPAQDLLPDLFASRGGSPTRHFTGWERPLVASAVAHLASSWEGRGALDLSDWLIVVPTRHASRRLREALAVHAAEKDAAVLPPLTVTPDFLTSPERVPGQKAAGQVETLLLWAAELLKLDLAAHRQLFPVDPVERSFAWAVKMAADLLQVRETLNESGLSAADVARMLENTEMEPERWRDLARLEHQCLLTTTAHGLTDWQVARRRAVREGELPKEVRRILVAGVLDPSGLAIQALERHAATLPVEVLVHAPASHQHHFDAWGRPLPEKWLSEPVRLPRPDQTIHAASTPAEQAGAVLDMLEPYPQPGEMVAIGLADSEVAAPLEKALAEHGIGAYDPAGRPMGTHGVFHLLRLLSQLCATRSFQAVSELFRCPDIAETIQQKTKEQTGAWPSLVRLFEDLDSVATETLPDTLDDALELAPRALDAGAASPVMTGLTWLEGVLKALEGAAFGLALTDFLAETFARRLFDARKPQDAVFAAIADQVSEVLDALEGGVEKLFPSALSAGSKLELLLRVLEKEVFYSERSPRDLDLQGWLELLWEDAPHLIVTGMNDGKVPESIVSHPFLPDSARRALGLRHNDTRFARDACLLTAIIELREHQGGRVDFLFGRTGSGGEPLRPSRLLLQCPDEELPARTLQFFQKPALRGEPLPWQLAWQLRPEPLPDDAMIFQRLRVTQFRDYLTCPFRFYLKHGLQMQEVDASSTEMDAMSFGNLLHHVLEKFATESAAAASTNADVIRAEFHRLLDARLHASFGPRLTVPVTIQREAARQRLAWWAEFEAAQRAEGWRIVAAEAPISPEGDAWTIGETVIRGVVDRIEEHPQHGIRLVDFKTYSPTAAGTGDHKSVEDYHLAKIKRTEDAASFAPWQLCQNSQGEEARWTDLQLPLYRMAMERRFPGRVIQTAYATLGRTKADVTLDVWPGLEGPLLESARECAEGVLAAIHARRFWPPAEKLPYGDDFGHLFFGDPLAAVDSSALVAAAS